MTFPNLRLQTVTRRLLFFGNERSRSGLIDVATQIGAFVLAMGALVGILAALNYDAGEVLSSLWNGSVGSVYAIGTSLSEATPLILTSVAVWLAAQGGVFNIGGDGQLQIGALAAFVAVTESGLPHDAWLLLPVGIVASALGGALWSGVAALIKSYRGGNEIIATLMLNFTAFIVLTQVMSGPLQSQVNKFTPQTDPIPTAAQINPLVDHTQLTWGVIVALVVGVAVLAYVTRTTTGLRLRAIGLNRDAARHSGMRISRYWLCSLTISGALCGLGGGLILMGLRDYLAPGWAESWGFEGILIAFLAFRTPFLIPLWALLFGMLNAAGPTLQGNTSVPSPVISIMQTLPVIVLFALYALGRLIRTRRGEIPRPTAGTDGRHTGAPSNVEVLERSSPQEVAGA